MKLITAACLWLECCNCGAIYEDVWPNIQKETPVCPHCGWSWYTNTENYKVCGPTKKHYRKKAPRESLEISSRWRRYQKVLAYLEKLPVDEWIAHETAWRLSKAEKINLLYAARIGIINTIDRVTGSRSRLGYREIPWPDNKKDNSPWEEVSLVNADTGQNTEKQSIALMSLEKMLYVWNNASNSGLTLWEAMSIQRPGNNTHSKEYKFYKRVKNQLWAFRRKLLEK